MLLLLILVFSPFAFYYFYVWMIYTLTVALARLLEAPGGSPEQRILRGGLLVGLALYATSAVSLRGSQAYGNLLAVNVLMLVVLGLSLRRGRPAALIPA
jgi:hypothetical protein